MHFCIFFPAELSCCKISHAELNPISAGITRIVIRDCYSLTIIASESLCFWHIAPDLGSKRIFFSISDELRDCSMCIFIILAGWAIFEPANNVLKMVHVYKFANRYAQDNLGVTMSQREGGGRELGWCVSGKIYSWCGIGLRLSSPPPHRSLCCKKGLGAKQSPISWIINKCSS